MKFRQSSIVFEKPGFLSEKLKTLTNSKYHRVRAFLLKLCTLFLLTNVCIFGIFLFCLDLELFAKNRKDLVSTHSLFTFLIIIQDLNEIKKNPVHPFAELIKQETCAKCQPKTLR